MPRTKKSTKQEADVATIAGPTQKDPTVDPKAASEIKDDHHGDLDKKKGAQDTANQNAPGGAVVAPVRKPLGTKEVIPFAWKVIGVSGEMVLTLFKSIEREDSEAHLVRLTRDGAYANLRLVEADFKIAQPKSVRAAFAASEKKAKTMASAKKSKKKKAKATAATIILAKKKTTTSAAKKTKKPVRGSKTKTVRASTTTKKKKKKKVKKSAKKSTSRTVKAKKSAKKAVKKKTTTNSPKKKTKKKKR